MPRLSMRILGLLVVVTTVSLASTDTDFFKTFKLSRNPCLITDAQATPQHKIAASTVNVPALDQLLVNKHADKAHLTALVFGRRGTGKSWARFHVVNALANQTKQPYVIELTETGVTDTAWRNYRSTMHAEHSIRSMFGLTVPNSWSNMDFSDLVMQVATHDLLSHVLALPHGNKLSKFLEATSTKNRQKLANILYLLAIIYDAPEADIVAFGKILGVQDKRERHYFGGEPIQNIKYHELVQEVRITTTSNEAGCDLIDVAITDMYPKSTVERFRKDSGVGHRGYTRIYLIDEIVRALGYERTVVIVDALDEVPSFQSDTYSDGTSVSLEKLTPILRSVLDESFLANVNIVAFLPVPKSMIRSDMLNHARCGKNTCIDLEWDYPLLVKMLDSHWRTSGGELSKFMGGDLSEMPFFKKVTRACTPRNILLACAKTIEHAVAFQSSNGFKADLRVFRTHLIERGCIELSWWESLRSNVWRKVDSEL